MVSPKHIYLRINSRPSYPHTHYPYEQCRRRSTAAAPQHHSVSYLTHCTVYCLVHRDGVDLFIFVELCDGLNK